MVFRIFHLRQLHLKIACEDAFLLVASFFLIILNKSEYYYWGSVGHWRGIATTMSNLTVIWVRKFL